MSALQAQLVVAAGSSVRGRGVSRQPLDTWVMHVLLATEGTYPYSQGGVSTWADMLVNGLPDVDFTVFAVVANPHVTLEYALPANVSALPWPQWGTELVEEYARVGAPLRRHLRPQRRSVRRDFLPIVAEVCDTLLLRPEEVACADAPEPGLVERLVEVLCRLAEYCASHDLWRAAHAGAGWDLFLDRLLANPSYRQLGLGEAVSAAKTFWRCLSPLAVPLPRVDAWHASAAAFSALPGVVAKHKHGTPLLLTEHGIYLRERVLALVREEAPEAERVIATGFYRGIVATCYRAADRILPVCEFNARWERYFDPGTVSRVQVVHNGVEPGAFPPSTEPDEPVAVFVGRIDPLKDVETLLHATVVARERVPGMRLLLYGEDSVPEYGERCRRLAGELGLGDVVEFRGATQDVQAAFAAGQVVVVSSVSEGLPFSLLEAMMSAKPIVATGVGGVPDALGDSRLVVPPRDADALGAAIADVLQMPGDERAALGAANRVRAIEEFSSDAFLGAYRSVYEQATGAAVAS